MRISLSLKGSSLVPRPFLRTSKCFPVVPRNCHPNGVSMSFDSVEDSPQIIAKKKPSSSLGIFSGSPGRTRTANLVVNSHPLCRLSYRGSFLIYFLAAPLIKPPVPWYQRIFSNSSRSNAGSIELQGRIAGGNLHAFFRSVNI